MSSRSLSRQIQIVLLVSFCLLNVFVIIIRKNHSDSDKFFSLPSIFGQGYIDEISDFEEDEYPTERNELDGCYHVFLDAGSNIGNTVRKLYEPHLFINASFLPIFKEYFGEENSRQIGGEHSVCAVGFEPNPKHSKWLKDLQNAYRKCGWKTKFHTKTAVAHSYGLATFYTDTDVDNYEWGASIVKSKKAFRPVGVAKMIRLSDYILHKVITRKLPNPMSANRHEQKPNVVIKLDIEGSELEILTDLLVTGSLQHIDFISTEYHPKSFTRVDERRAFIEGLEKALDTITYLSQRLRLNSVINVKNFEDESYGKVMYPLPECLN